jgi:hypothetical protein
LALPARSESARRMATFHPKQLSNLGYQASDFHH